MNEAHELFDEVARPSDVDLTLLAHERSTRP